MGSLRHMQMQNFWDDVYKAIDQNFKVVIPRDLKVATLGIISPGVENKAEKYPLSILLTAALKCITNFWLKTEPPSLQTTKSERNLAFGKDNLLTETPTMGFEIAMASNRGPANLKTNLKYKYK